MRHLGFFTLFIALYLYSLPTYGQLNSSDKSIQQEKLLLAKASAINSVRDYASSVTLRSDYTKRKFPDKFSSDAVHVNDVLLSSDKFEVLNIEDYIQLLKDFYKSENVSSIEIDCDIKDVNTDLQQTEITFYEGNVKSFVSSVDISAIKHITFKNEFGLVFNEAIPIEFTVEIVQDKHKRLMSSISSVVCSKDFVPFDYAIANTDNNLIPKPDCKYDNILSNNDNYILIRFYDPSSTMVFMDPAFLRDDVEVNFTTDRDQGSFLLKTSSALDQKKSFCFTYEYGFSPKSLNVNPDIGLINESNISNEISLDFKINLSRKSYWQAFIGFGYVNSFSNFSANQFDESRTQTDYDGSNYARLSTYNDFRETLQYSNMIARGGLQSAPLEFTEKLSGRIKVFSALSFNSNVKFENRCLSFHRGYYEELYGITIDENYIYDFGNYQTSNSEELNTLASQLDLGGSIVLDYSFYESLSKGFGWIISPQFGFAYRQLTFNTNDTGTFEVTPQKVNTITSFLDSYNMYFIKFGVSISITEIPKLIPCK